MAKQAKYLIDDAKFHIAGVATSWDYDNRTSSEPAKAFPEYLYDEGNSCGVRVKREFQEQTGGKMVLENFFVTAESADGVCVKITSTKGQPVIEYTTRNGTFYFNGCDTGVASILGETRTKVTFDLDTKKAKFAVNGETAGFYDLGDFCDAGVIYIGTTGENKIKVTPIKNKLYVDYIANETFVGTQKYFPDEWTLDGDFEVCYHNTSTPQMNYTYAKTTVKKGEKSIAFLPVEKTQEDVIVEGYFLLPEGADGFNFSLVNGEETVFGIKSEGNEFKTLDGAFLRKFTSNVWQVLRIETKAGEVLVKIDGKKCGTFTVDKVCFDALEVFFEPDTDATLCFTDIVCEANIDYEDYCPKPELVKHPEYEVGINICNMWREGHHFGWDRITYFNDNMPLIGPYDEGLPEVADWEIKFMVEHGITFQHFCWYCPDSMINTPIKRSRMDHALRDGFMNARYSDMMKFIIMWENAGYTNTNPQDFLDYVWPYWCEYFFTDSRYLIINNRPLISMWMPKFVDNWGGPEKAREIIDFINEDIKKYGYDGVYIMNTATREYNGYKYQSEFCDITYAYHYGANGYNLKYQLGQIDLLTGFCEKDGLSPFMQTVSVGYNDCAWRGPDKRVPLISLEDHKTALKYIKKHGDERVGDNWYDKIFMLSTWNEYGEGTYMMPCNLHGFGYLDNVREVFVPESGKCDNVLPSENQQKRITYLNKLGRGMIRRLGFEKPDYLAEPNTVVRTWNFADGAKYDEASAFGKAAELEYTGSSVMIKPVAEADHYSFHIKGDKYLCNGKDVTFVKFRVRVHGDSNIRFAFLAEGAARWNGSMCLNNDHYSLCKEDGYVDLLFAPVKLQTWRGANITDIRLDNMVNECFEVESVTFMVRVDDSDCFKSLTVNGRKLAFDINPKYDDKGRLVVSLDPEHLFFRSAKLYQEYSIARGELTVASQNVTSVFTVDSDKAMVNGNEVKLGIPMTMLDGLPTFVLTDLCSIFGFRYTDDNGVIEVTSD